jgi:hypothetical protein
MKSETPARPRGAKTPKRRETQLRGIAVSPGIAIGPVFDTSEAPAEAPRRRITTEAIEAERVRLVGELHKQRVAVGVAVHRDRADAHLAQRPHHTDGDLTTVGHQHGCEHQRVLRSSAGWPTPSRIPVHRHSDR